MKVCAEKKKMELTQKLKTNKTEPSSKTMPVQLILIIRRVWEEQSQRSNLNVVGMLWEGWICLNKPFNIILLE